MDQKFTVYGITTQEQFQEGPNNGCVEVVVICCTGHGNGKFFKNNALWKTETKLISSDTDITAYSHKTLLMDKLEAFFKAQKPVGVLESKWLQPLVDELNKNRPATEVNESASLMKEDIVTIDLETPQCDVDASVDVKGVLCAPRDVVWFQVSTIFLVEFLLVQYTLNVWSAIICVIMQVILPVMN